MADSDPTVFGSQVRIRRLFASFTVLDVVTVIVVLMVIGRYFLV